MLKIYFENDFCTSIKINLYSNPDIFGFYPFFEKLEFTKILDELYENIYSIEFWCEGEMLDKRYFDNENFYDVNLINKHNILNYSVEHIEIKDDLIFGVLVINYEDEPVKNTNITNYLNLKN